MEQHIEGHIKYLQETKLFEIGRDCISAIHKGVTIDGKHYSLTEHDQAEIMRQYIAIMNGAEMVPYHADKGSYQMLTVDEFMKIHEFADKHIFSHRIYCNHLNNLIHRTNDFKALTDITYGSKLPEDLQISMNSFIDNYELVNKNHFYLRI